MWCSELCIQASVLPLRRAAARASGGGRGDGRSTAARCSTAARRRRWQRPCARRHQWSRPKWSQLRMCPLCMRGERHRCGWNAHPAGRAQPDGNGAREHAATAAALRDGAEDAERCRRLTPWLVPAPDRLADKWCPTLHGGPAKAVVSVPVLVSRIQSKLRTAAGAVVAGPAPGKLRPRGAAAELSSSSILSPPCNTTSHRLLSRRQSARQWTRLVTAQFFLPSTSRP